MTSTFEMMTKWYACKCHTTNCSCSKSIYSELIENSEYKIALDLTDYVRDKLISDKLNEVGVFPTCINNIISTYLHPLKIIPYVHMARIRQLVPRFKISQADIIYYFHELKEMQQNENDGIFEQYAQFQITAMINKYVLATKYYKSLMTDVTDLYNTCVK
jgi:hypothetical protein